MASGSTVVRSDFPMFMTPKGRAALAIKFDDTKSELPEMRQDMYEMKNTTNAFDQEMSMVGLGLYKRKPEINPVQFDKPQTGRYVSFTYPTYALAVALSREAQEDDATNQLASFMTEELKRAMIETQEIDAANLLNFGFTFMGYEPDQQPLFSTAHPLVRPVGGVTTYTNRSATNMGLGLAALEAARTELMLTRNDTGRFMPLRPKTLWVHPANLTLAEQLVGTQKVTGSNDNDKNVFYGMMDVKANPRFTNPFAWFIQTTGKNPFRWWTRRPMDYQTDTDILAGILMMMGSARWTKGFVNARGWYGSNAAS